MSILDILPFLALISGFLIVFSAIPVIIKISRIKNLTDNPDGIRKKHLRIVPVLGGVALFAGFTISYGVFISFELPQYLPQLMAAITIIFFIGIKDDILIIAPLKKLAGQIIAVSIIVILGGIHIPGLDGIFGVHRFPAYSAELFSIFAIIIIINAYNLIDGIDGLAGMLSFIGSAVFGIWFIKNGHYAEAVLCFSLAGALAGFSYYNFEPAKIFMGDTGSQVIGLIMAVSAFRLIELNPYTSSSTLEAPALFAFSVMIIPMFDTLRIIIVRILKRQSPLKPDNGHIHHLLCRLGLKHSQVVIFLSVSTLVITGVTYLINSINPNLAFAAVILMAASILPLARGVTSLNKNVLRRHGITLLNTNGSEKREVADRPKVQINHHRQNDYPHLELPNYRAYILLRHEKMKNLEPDSRIYRYSKVFERN